ncbi:coiled-coil domain-containing protein 110 [Lithobates pipiens]
MAEAPGADNRETGFQVVSNLNRSFQNTLEAFQQQLQFICDLLQQTLEGVDVLQSQVADTLNLSIGEIESFRSSLLIAPMTIAMEKENEERQTKDIICIEDQSQHPNSTVEEDTVTSEQSDLTEPFSDGDENSPLNTDTQQNYNLQHTNADNRKPGESNVSFKNDGVNLQDIWKQDSYTEHMNGTEGVDSGNVSTSDSTFNAIESGPLCSTMKNTECEEIVQDDTLHIMDLIQPRDSNYFSHECVESGPSLEEIEDNKSTPKKGNLNSLFKSKHEETAGLNRFSSEADQAKNPDQPEGKAFKALRQLHICAQSLNSEHLQYREQINTLIKEKTSLREQLSIAEQDAEAYHQQSKAVIDKCEELLKKRKQIQDERNDLRFEKYLLMKDLEMMKEEKEKILKDLSTANIENEELLKKLNSSKKIALSYAREKQVIHCLWNKTLKENSHLRREADESRTQLLKITQEYQKKKEDQSGQEPSE